MAQLLLIGSELPSGSVLDQALQLLESRLVAWASSSNSAYEALLQEVFGAQSSEATTALQASISGSGLGISLEILDGGILSGINAAYTSLDPTGNERIYLNAAWLRSATAIEIEAVLLEELGHAIDHRLNSQHDSPGDEGEIFSALLRGSTPADSAFCEDDRQLIHFNGVAVALEAADTIAPTITQVASSTTNGSYDIGAVITLIVEFAEAVFVTTSAGTPRLQLETGSVDRYATYRGGSGTNTLSFQYTVQSGDNSLDLDQRSSTALQLNGGTIQDAAGNNAVLTLAAPGTTGSLGANTALVIDAKAPTGGIGSYATDPAYKDAGTNPYGIKDVGGDSTPAFADADADGDLDLFIGNEDGNIRFFRNTAALGATAPAYATAVTNPFGIGEVYANARPAFADADADGDLDLFIGDYEGGTYFFRNTAALGATAPAYAAANLNPFGISNSGMKATPAFADVDGDGDQDLFIGNIDGNTRFFRNTAALGATAPAYVASGYNPFGISNVYHDASPAFADADADGDLDLFIGDYFGDTRFFRNTAALGATTPAYMAADTNPFGIDSVGSMGSPAFADADGDGDLDLWIGEGDGNTFVFRNNAAPGATAPSYSLATNPVGINSVGSVTSPAFADVDGDGDQDLFIGNAAGDTRFYRNTGSAVAPAYADAAINPFGITRRNYGWANPAFADADGDGDLDLFIGDYIGDTHFFRNTAALGATAPAYAAAATNPFGIIGESRGASPAFADADGDGDLDLFVGNKGKSIHFFRNTAAPGATAPAYAAPSTNPFGITEDPWAPEGNFSCPDFVDTDGDGDLDLFISTLDGRINFFRNTAALGATAPAYAAAVLNPFGFVADVWLARLAFADGDGDGDLELFFGCSDGGIRLFWNTAATPVAAVTSTTSNGSYGIGAAITLTVPFSEAVIVTGSPTLQLETGSVDRFAFYSGGSGTNTLSFLYIVQAGDGSSDLNHFSANALSLNGGTIKDAIGHNAVLTLATPGATGSLAANKALLIDGKAPTGSLGSYASAPAYAAAATNPFGINDVGSWARPAFADADRDGDLDLFIGNAAGNTHFFRNTAALGATAPAYATAVTNPFGIQVVGQFATPAFVDADADGDLDLFIGNTAGNTLLFSNTAAPGATAPAYGAAATNPFGISNVGSFASPTFADVDADGDLDLLIGNAAGDTLFFSNTAGYGATAPAYDVAVTNPFGISDVGNDANPAFMDADGDGDLDLFIGHRDGDTLLFRNTGSAVAPGFAAASGNPFGISDVGSNANPAFVDADGDGDLDLFIGHRDGDTLFFSNTAATPVARVSSSTFRGTYRAGAVIVVTVQFSEVVVVTGTPTLQLETGSIDRVAFYSGGSGTNTLSFLYTVQDGDFSSDLDQFSANALSLNGGTIKDAIGNNAVLTLATPGDTGSLASNKALVIDPAAPAPPVSSITPNGSYGIGSAITLTVMFSGAVDVTGTPTLQLETGNIDRVATYRGGSGTKTLSFLYTVQAGDTSNDLDQLSCNGLNLNGGEISGDNVVLTLDAPGATGSLAGNKALVIDTKAPTGRLGGYATAPAYAASVSNPFGVSNVGSMATPAFADADADGDLDLFIGNMAGNVFFFRNTAAPGATAPAYAAATTNPFGISDVGEYARPAFADADADGDLDLFIGNMAGNVLFFRNSAASGTTAPAYAAAATNPFGITDVGLWASPAFADADGDGDLDLFIGNGVGDTLLFRNTAFLGATAPAYDVATTNPFGISAGPPFASPAFADADGDGDLDLFIGYTDGITRFFRNTAAPGSTAPAYAVATINSFGVSDVGNNASPAFADADADGDLDLFIGNDAGNTRFFRNTAATPVAPASSTTPSGSYGIGAVITVTVQFSEAVWVTGSPTLQLETGTVDRLATYISGSGSDLLLFHYTVQAGDTSADLDQLAARSLSPNGGSIRDGAGNNAVCTLAAPGAVGSLGANAALVIDTTAPTMTSAGTASVAENSSGIAYQATASDPAGPPSFTWTLGGSDAALFDIDSAGALSFKNSPNFEAPTDSGANNVYDITVTASDSANNSSSPQAVVISVTDENEAPRVTSGGSASVAENSSGTAYQATGTDPDAGTTLSWSLGGTDAALFTINSATGALSFISSPNYEAPADNGGNNVYDITVTANDGSLSSTPKAVAITVTKVNEAPVVTSAASTSVAENSSGTAYQATGTDPDAGTTLSWSLGGTDAALFTINSATGALSFISSPNYEAPADNGGNNVYDITVTANDGSLSSTPKAVAITVTKVNEAPTALSLLNPLLSLPETTNTAVRVKVADFSLSDDALGTNTYSLTGNDAASFEVLGSALYLRAGTNLSYASGKISYSVTLNASDPSLPASSPLQASQTLAVIDTPPAVAMVDALQAGVRRPTVTGSIAMETGSTLEVTVNNRTYTLGSGLSISGNRWQVAIGEDLADGIYDVVARHTDATNNVSTDSSTAELVVAATASIRTVQIVLNANGAEDSGAAGTASTIPSSFVISRSTADTNQLVVFYTLSGSAKADVDYQLPANYDSLSKSGSLTIAAGATSAALNLVTLNNSIYDSIRTITVGLVSNAGYTISSGVGSATSTLVDNDPKPTPPAPVFSISDQDLVEGSGGTWLARKVRVSLNEAASQPLSVDLSFALTASGLPNATASGADYQATNQRLTFAIGVTSMLVDVQVFGDVLAETPSEYLYARLSNASVDASISATQGSARLTIVDDDYGKTLDYSAATTGNSAIYGSDYSDSITGSNFVDNIYAAAGNDSVRGGGGADGITLGAGADRLIYASYAESSLTSTADQVDRITDFERVFGDRIQLSSPPAQLWSAGSSTKSTLMLAVQSVFLDRNPLQSGLQALGSNEAVLFRFGSGRTERFYVAVNDSTAGYQGSQDLLLDVTGASTRADTTMFTASGSALTVSHLFV